MIEASNRVTRVAVAIFATACISLLLMLAATCAHAASGSAKDQYVGSIPAAEGENSPAATSAPIANQNGVVTPDSVKSASEDADEKSKDEDEDAKSGAAAGTGKNPPSGAIPPGTVGNSSGIDSESTGFTLTNFNSPTGAATAGVILIAAGGAMLAISRRRFGAKPDSSTYSAT